MKRQYNILPEPLHSVADSAIAYFIKNRGVRQSSIQVEQPIPDHDLPYRPTFTGETSDNYLLAVDVGRSPYNNSLDDFVIACMHQGLPIKLYIAIPQDTKDPDYAKKLSDAKTRGIGVLEVGERSVRVMQEALPLSLIGVRPINVAEFPAKLREPLHSAETIFRNGSPVKACALVFDEIESICRQLATKTYAAGFWNSTTAINLNFDHGPWAKLMEVLEEHLDTKRAKCPKLTAAFLARIRGITPYRNESGHKPKNEEELKRRDRELRTRFESAVDLLRDLVEAVRPLRLL